VRVVLDTNVLVAAIFFLGPPSRILSAWLEDKFELAVSAEILAEYRGTTTRIGEKFPGVDFAAVLDRIALHSLLVLPVKLPYDACEDRDDVKFLACALGARAKYVITGDRANSRPAGT